MNIVAIIPVFNPGEKFVRLISELSSISGLSIIVINDGSSQKTLHYFDVLKDIDNCKLLTQSVNLGKGRALKTAFNYFLNNYGEKHGGVITIDGDGQHLVQDVKRCCEVFKSNPESLVLGCRNFNNPDIPFKSRFGNITMSLSLKLFCGINIHDTQTGLRVIPRSFLGRLLTTEGERYEYETNMLLQAKKCDIPFLEVPITTVYINSNKETHFKPITDSIKVYALLLKYSISAFSSFLIDIFLFTFISVIFRFLPTNQNIFISTFGARVISSLFNYSVNLHVVFQNKMGKTHTILKYYILVILQTSVSYALVYLFVSRLRVNSTAIKIPVDFLLFFINFYIQREWVFKKEKFKAIA